MKKILLTAALSAVLAPLAGAASAHSGDATIHISCFRGPWHEVIIDRANPEFIDSLLAVGYNISDAHAIGDRICRNQATVGDPDAMKADMYKILQEAPIYRRR